MNSPNSPGLALFIFLSFSSCRGQVIKSISELFNKADCENYLDSKNLEYRFSPGQLKAQCGRQEMWFEDVVSRASVPMNSLLTDNQLQWLNGIWDCRDISCICSSINCNDLVSQVSKGIGGPELPFNLGFGRNKRQAPLDLFRQKLGPVRRKEYRMLTDAERKAFHDALNALKADVIDGLSKYDILTIYHTPEQSPGAHFGPALLPFHRELLKQLEIAMRTVNPSVGLPYWDSTLDQPLPDPKDSILWTEEFMGNGNNEVVTGPFAHWRTIPDSQIPDLSRQRRIVRNVGAHQYGGLYREEDLRTIAMKQTFRELTFCVDPYFELVHGTIHMWIGGHMLELRISPNDPIFFLLHSFVDKIWEDFRQNRQTPSLREDQYVDDNRACNSFHYGQNPMRPFKMRNRDGLSNAYTENFFQFDPSPSCSRMNPYCGSPYLFCDLRFPQPRCVSKVKIGGNCTSLENTDVCYKGGCVLGRCKAAPIRVTLPPTTTTTTPTPTTTRRRRTRPPTRRRTTRRPRRVFRTRATARPKPVRTTARPRDRVTFRFTRWWLFPTTPTPPRRRPQPTPAPFRPRPQPTPSPFRRPQPTPSQFRPRPRPQPTPAPFRPRPQPRPDSVTSSEPDASTKTVWFPITVLRADARTKKIFPFREGNILTDHANGLILAGQFARPSEKPYYTGSAFARMISPFENPGSQVKAQLKVLDERGRNCASLCLDHTDLSPPWNYKPCEPQVQLDVDPRKSDDIPFSPILEQAKFLNWNDGSSRKAPDPFLFLCHARTVRTPTRRVTTRRQQRQRPVEVETNVIGSPTIQQFRPATKIGGTDRVKIQVDEIRNITEDACLNTHRCCSLWADVGECSRNKWMQHACPRSCFVCNRGMQTSPAGCSDNNRKCAAWAKRGNCSKNQNWMQENCRRSCGVCNRSMIELQRLCGSARKRGECRDYRNECRSWAKRNECKRNPWWMRENCPFSCKAC